MFGYKAVFNVRVVITYLLYHIEEITQNSHFSVSFNGCKSYCSGAGKSTLLNFLTSNISATEMTISGDVRVNGVDVGSGMKNISGYVRQDEMFIPRLTVKEHLIFRVNILIHFS